jgi:hypothetical protein
MSSMLYFRFEYLEDIKVDREEVTVQQLNQRLVGPSHQLWVPVYVTESLPELSDCSVVVQSPLNRLMSCLLASEPCEVVPLQYAQESGEESALLEPTLQQHLLQEEVAVLWRDLDQVEVLHTLHHDEPHLRLVVGKAGGRCNTHHVHLPFLLPFLFVLVSYSMMTMFTSSIISSRLPRVFVGQSREEDLGWKEPGGCCASKRAKFRIAVLLGDLVGWTGDWSRF